MYHIEVHLASKTLKQDNEEKEFDHHAQSPPQPELPSVAGAQFDEVMNMLPVKSQEMDERFQQRRAQLSNDFLPGSLEYQIQPYVRFIPKKPLQSSVQHQVSPSGESHITQAQPANTDIQRMIRVLMYLRSRLTA